jgi:hypothetical protein
MAKKPTSHGKRGSSGVEPDIPEPVKLIADDEHPDCVEGLISDAADLAAESAAYTPDPRGPLPAPLPPDPQLPRPPEPILGPIIPPPHIPSPINICGPVSGRYVRVVRHSLPLQPLPHPLTLLTVRVDVDRFFPQDRISLEARRIFPRQTAHVIAKVTSNVCTGFNRRRVTAQITYRDGSASLIPGDNLVFEARRTTGKAYGAYTLTLRAGTTTIATYALSFVSRYFDEVEFEVDRVANAQVPTTTYATQSHPNRPADLPNETVSMATVYERAGFGATMSPNTSVIPTSGAGANGTWSDAEMHNAMVTYWSRFADKPQWAMWVLFAHLHDLGRSLGGVMFDDIGPNHRQGTAIFTDSFIQDSPAGDPDAAAWRRRMVFWTAIHEMGHAFNLAHSWQKSLGSPWFPLLDEPQAGSYMNYPFRVAGGQTEFFADFRFRFSDQELLFMRHAPRRFVQMGNSNWFVNHGFEAPESLLAPKAWRLEIRPNREVNEYAFMEPVKLELKLTNETGEPRSIDLDLLADGAHVAVFVGREGGRTKPWNPFVTRCQEPQHETIAPDASIYGAHLIGASTGGWLIDEPGFYKVQAAVDVDGEVVVSNVLRLFVSPPTSDAASQLAPDYFTEDVGRVLAFQGAPELEQATNTLREVLDRLPDAAAAIHSAVAVSSPLLHDFKHLEGEGKELAIKGTAAKVSEAAKTQLDAMVKAPAAAAETLGHIDYFADMAELADALEAAGDTKGAIRVLKASISTMRKRGVIQSVVGETESRLSSID